MYTDREERSTVSRLLELCESDIKLDDTEVLRLLLTGLSLHYKAYDAACDLINDFMTLDNVCSQPLSVLSQYKGVGCEGARILKACRSACANMTSSRDSENLRSVMTLDEMVDCLLPYYAGADVEKMYIILSNRKQKLLAVRLIAVGAEQLLTVSPTKILSEIVRYRAAHVVMSHCHMKSLVPSVGDKIITQNIALALKSVNAILDDHIIFCENRYKSMLVSGHYKPNSLPLKEEKEKTEEQPNE